jgi:hypothetical protein
MIFQFGPNGFSEQFARLISSSMLLTSIGLGVLCRRGWYSGQQLVIRDGFAHTTPIAGLRIFA